MSVKPKSSYNPLTDPHLAAHYASRRQRKHLKSAGLIKRNGELVSERDYFMNNQLKETKNYMKDLLAQAVVHKALEVERQRQVSIRDQLELMAKKERVRRIRAERSKTTLDMSYHPRVQSAPRSKSEKNQSQDGSRKNSLEAKPRETQKQKIKSLASVKAKEIDRQTLKMIKKEVDRQKAFGPGPSPFAISKTDVEVVAPSPRMPKTLQSDENLSFSQANKKSSGHRLHRPEPGMIVKVRQQSLCEMKFKYIGRPGIGETAFLDPEDVVIEQQHCGGETIKVYHGLIKAGDKFTFVSRRHRGFPFSFVMYVNSIRIERISGCCEYRFKKGSKLGTGTLKFLSVSGAAPCFRCNVRKGLIKDKPDPAPRPKSRTDSNRQSAAPRSHASQVEAEQESDSEYETEASQSDDENSDHSEAENSDKSENEIDSEDDSRKNEPEIKTVDPSDDEKDELSQSDNVEKHSSEKSSSEAESSSDSESEATQIDVTENDQTSSESKDEKTETIDDTPRSPDVTEGSDINTKETEKSEGAVEIIHSSENQVADEISDNSGKNTPKSPEREKLNSNESDARDTPSSAGITSPLANDLVNQTLLKVSFPEGVQPTKSTENENMTSESISGPSPTSPFANQMVDDLIDKLTEEKLPDTARTDVSETFTNVTEPSPRSADSVSSSSTFSESSSSSTESKSK